MRTYSIALVCLVACSCWSNVAAQGTSYEEFTARITEQLRAADPDATDLFVQANAARDSENYAEAERLYREVLHRQPDFFHAARRLSSVLLAQEKHGAAVQFARRALASSEAPNNRNALIQALLAQPVPTAVGTAEALRHATELMRTPNLMPEVAATICLAAAHADDLALLQSASLHLRSTAPEHPLTHYWWWVTAMVTGDWEAANVAVDRAREFGIADDVYRDMRAATDDARPLLDRYKPLAAALATTWGAGFVVLLLAGIVLSGLALRASRQPVGVQSGESVGLSGTIRNAYRVVLWLSCAFYYFSIPLVVIVVLAVGGGLLYFFFTLGRIPIKLALIVLGLTLFTLWAILRSLLIRAAKGDPGERMSLDEHSRFRELLDEVAEQIGTRAVDNVYLTPGTDLAVMERGGVLRQLGGTTERCLILGAGVLQGLRKRPFMAVLAHEYGHFSNRDTAGGGFALAVRRSVMTMAIGLVEGGAAAWYNPAWTFVNGFQRIFLRISQGASRLQEVLADRWAAFAYGAAAFEAGLRHVIQRGIEFDVRANVVLREFVEDATPLSNLYDRLRGPYQGEKYVAEAVEAAINAKPSPYDSHPSPVDRFTLVRALDTDRDRDLSDSNEEVWSLFGNRSEIERRMTQHIVASVEAAHSAAYGEIES